MKNIKPNLRGFTLIELLITMAIAALLMMVATPSFTEFLRNNKLRSVVNGISGALMIAKSEAMTRDSQVYLIPYSDNDWNKGWRVFVDLDRSGTFNAGDTSILVVDNIPELINISADSLGGDLGSPYVMYDGSGFSKQKSGAFLAGTISVKRTDNAAINQIRRIKIASSGKVRVCTPVAALDPSCQASSADE